MNQPQGEPQLPNSEPELTATRPLKSPSEPTPSHPPSLGSLFATLPKEGQLLLLCSAIGAGFVLLSLFVKLVSLAFSLALLGGFLYIGYKFLSASSAGDKNP